jgi:hypothetical protein
VYDQNGNLIASAPTTPGSNQSSDYKTATISWTHELAPDLSMSISGAYSLIRRSGVSGTDEAGSFAAGLRYAVNPTTILTGRYSFFDRISKLPGYSLYENMLLLGLTKKF